MALSSCRQFGRLLVALVMVSVVGLAQAGLTALVEDASDGSLRVVAIDSGTGQVIPGTAAIDDCCLVGAGLSAIDVAGERVFAFGIRNAGDLNGQPILMTLSLDGSETHSVETDQLPQSVLGYDSQSDRLVSTTYSVDGTQWISLDPDTGQANSIGSPMEDCCEIVSGLAAVGNLPAGPRALYFVGRDHGASAWQLLAVELATGGVTSIAELPEGTPGMLVLDEQTGQLDLLLQTAIGEPSALYRVDPAVGTASLVATQAGAGCCLISPGDVASLDLDGEYWWVGGSRSDLSSPASGYLALAAGFDAGVVPAWQIEPGYRLHALMVTGAVVNPGWLFRDRFEL
jgi:hypothetical protein